MDIAKYTGLFLVKNEYCYLPGIGSLQIIKKPAKYDKEAGNMMPPEYTVVYEQGYGSIDDSFANFIANNERISIAHASNYLKDYCHDMKQRLQEGEEVVIPAIGKFKMDAQQVIGFETDPHLNVKGKTIPIFKNSATVEQKKEDALTKIIENTEIREPKGDEEIIIKPPTINWSKIIVLILVIVGLIAALVYFITNLSKSKSQETTEVTPAVQQQAHTIDEETNKGLSQESVATKSDSYMVAIKEYQHYEDAARRMNQLNTYGNHTLVWTEDSSVFYVVISLPNSKDKQKAVDSLRIFFNPEGNVRVVGQ